MSEPVQPAPLWDMSLTVDARRALTAYKATPDPLYGWPLYGYKPTEMLGKACTEWESFIGSFVHHWNNRFHYDPHPEIVKQARTFWKRYSMTGYEAFATVMNKARDDAR